MKAIKHIPGRHSQIDVNETAPEVEEALQRNPRKNSAIQKTSDNCKKIIMSF